MSGRSRAATLLGAVGAGALAALVASCGGTKDAAEMSCPIVVAAPGTNTIAVFRPGSHEPKDLLVAGEITEVSSTCVRETPGVGVTAEITFYAERSNMQVTNGTLPYFVALVDAEQHVLAEEAFELKFPFLPGERYRKLPPEKRTIHLPVHTRSAANSFTVAVGFQLTPDQLAFNRARATNAP